MNEEFDLSKYMCRETRKHKVIIDNIVDEYDTLDLLLKLIALNQLNIHKEIINGLGYALIERFVIENKSRFSHKKEQLIPKDRFLEFVDEYTLYKVQSDISIIPLEQRKISFEYESFVDFYRDVKGDAFIHQLLNQNYEILNNVKESFKHHIGFDFDSFFKFITTLQHLFINKIMGTYEKIDIDSVNNKEDLVDIVYQHEMYRDLLISDDDILSFKFPEQAELSNDEFKFYIEKFSSDIEDEFYKEHHHIESKPLMKFGNDYLLISHHYLTWNMSDKIIEIVSVYKTLFEKFNVIRGEWLESKSYQYLLKIFDENYIFKNPYYYVDGELCEGDILIDYHNTILIFECKSQHMKVASKIGSILRFRKDVKRILEESYTQSDRLRKNVSGTLVKDDFSIYKSDGETIVHKIPKGSPDKIIMINISLDNLRGLGTMLNKFHEEGVYKQGVDIVNYNIHDFEFITDFLSKPYKFIDYTIKRIERVKKYYVSDELDYLGWYHDTLLNQEFEMEYSSIYMAENYIPYFEKYIHNIEDKMKLYIDQRWVNLLDKISDIEYPNKTLLELCLLNIKEEGINNLLEQLETLKNDKSIMSGEKVKTVTVIPTDDFDPNMVITFICQSKTLKKETLFNMVLSKVRNRFKLSKKKHWFIIAFYSQSMDVRTVIHESSNVYIKVGRNDPCPCGSGLKYKKCCWK